MVEVLVVLVIVLIVVVEVVVVDVGGKTTLVVEVEVTLVVMVVVPLGGLTGGWPGYPRQAPYSPWQPAPQYSTEEPHQKNWEQQGPQPVAPTQTVLLPHWPLVVTTTGPEGPVGVGTGTEVVEVGLVVVVVVVVVELVVVGGGGGALVVEVVDEVVEVVEVVGGAGGSLGHPQLP